MEKEKVILMGDSGVGKTAIYQRLLHNYCPDALAPTIVGSAGSLKYMFEGTEFNFNLWDTAGQEKFRSTAVLYFRNAQLGILVFSVVDAQSFANAGGWLEHFRSIQPDTQVILVGNKSDLTDERTISFEVGSGFAESKGISGYVEMSARTGEGVEELLQEIAKSLKTVRQSATLTVAEVNLSEPEGEESKTSCC
jgi:small GTP-binding protein